MPRALLNDLFEDHFEKRRSRRAYKHFKHPFRKLYALCFKRGFLFPCHRSHLLSSVMYILYHTYVSMSISFADFTVCTYLHNTSKKDLRYKALPI